VEAAVRASQSGGTAWPFPRFEEGLASTKTTHEIAFDKSKSRSAKLRLSFSN